MANTTARAFAAFLPWLSAPIFFLELVRGSPSQLNWSTFVGLIVLGYFSLLVLILVHEAGHLVAAKLVGIRIRKFIVGGGGRLQFNLKGTLWSFRLIPSHGYVVPQLSGKSFSFYRQGLFAAGGLIAQSLFLSVIYLHLNLLWQDLRNQNTYSLAYIYSTLLLFGTIIGVKNAIPSVVTIEGQPYANDGLLLHRLWKNRKALPQRQAEWRALQCVEELMERGKVTEAIGQLDDFREKFPRGSETLCLGAHQASEMKNFVVARSFLEAALKLNPQPGSERIHALDNLASMVIYYERWEWLADAEAWIREAREASPDEITLDGTLGSILAELDFVR